MPGASNGQYKESDFVKDFKGGHTGFTVHFFLGRNGTRGAATPLHRKRWQIVDRYFYLIGLPTSPWCFDLVFKCASDMNKLHFCLLQFYEEFEGGVTACLAVHNSYPLAHLADVESSAKRNLKKVCRILRGRRQ